MSNVINVQIDKDFYESIINNNGGGATKPRWTGHADVEGLKAIG